MTRAQNFDATAQERIKIIGPIIFESLDPAKRILLLKQISERENISERTLRRWISSYQESGYKGLMPKTKPGNQKNSLPESIVDQAVILRREVPSRSIRQIITILEMEGHASPGQIKRSTLQDRLMKRGYSSRQLAMYHSSGAGAARRFERTNRNDLWQLDIKYLLVLPETAKRDALQVYACVIIDDASRLCISCKLYDKQTTSNVLAGFRQGIEEFGLPDRVFTDNGSQYISKQLNQACAKLGIRKLTARPRAASSKGKVEVFNKYLDTFVNEVKLKRPQTIAQVQGYLDAWIHQLYHNKAHSALEGKTPLEVFKGDAKQLRWATKEQLDTAFTFTEKRLVDKTGCLSFKNILWEAGQDLIGMRVDIAYRPDNPDQVEVFHEGIESRIIYPLVITPRSAPRKHPLPIQTKSPKTSREIDAAQKLYEKSMDLSKTAISFENMLGEVKDNV